MRNKFFNIYITLKYNIQDSKIEYEKHVYQTIK